jgi:hypothetical protein
MQNRKQLQGARLDELLTGCRESTIDAVITQFGLNRAMFTDKVGGNLPTPRNAKNGIFPNERAKESYSKFDPDNYNRDDYEDKNRRGHIYKEANRKLVAGQQVQDAYANRPLVPGKRKIHTDHVAPLKEASQNEWMHIFCGEEKRRAIMNSPGNIALTSQSINTSKNAKSISKLLESDFVEKHDASAQKMWVRDKKARVYIQAEVVTETVKIVGKEAGKEAGKLAAREAIGLLMAELVKALYDEANDLWRLHSMNVDIDWAAEFKLRAVRIKTRLMARLKDAGKAAKNAGLAGLISALVTWGVNFLIQTAKHIVGAIRQAILSLIQAGKVLLTDASPEEKARAAAKILAGSLSVIAGIILDESLKNLLSTIPFLQMFATEISATISAIATGLLTALSMFIIDTLFDKLQYPIDAERLESAEHSLELQNKLCLAAEALFVQLEKIQQEFEALSHKNDWLIRSNERLKVGQATALGQIEYLLGLIDNELMLQEGRLRLDNK